MKNPKCHEPTNITTPVLSRTTKSTIEVEIPMTLTGNLYQRLEKVQEEKKVVHCDLPMEVAMVAVVV